VIDRFVGSSQGSREGAAGDGRRDPLDESSGHARRERQASQADTLPSFPQLVGRAREQRRLRQHLTAALAGRGSLVLISGEMGIGKTALAEELGRVAATQDALVVTGQCYDLSDTPAYAPWVRILERLQAILPLETAVDSAALAESASASELFALVGQSLSAAATARPLMLVLEDLHWGDPASFELLRFVARLLANLPLLILVTYRDDEVTRQHPLYLQLPVLVHDSRANRLDLRLLTLTDVQALLTHTYGPIEPDSPAFAAYLHEYTEGNPLFLTELLRSLEADRFLWRADDGDWHVEPIADAPVPMLLRQLTEGRVAQLGVASVALLATAAVIGREVPLALWSSVTGSDEEQLLALIHNGAGALFDARWSDDGIRFRHVLFRRVLYEMMPSAWRRQSHGAVADALIATNSPDPDTVAYHLGQARDPRAVAWYVAAGERAEQTFAFITAAERFDAARALLDSQAGDARARGWLRLRGAYLRRFVDSQAALDSLDEADTLAVDAKDPYLAARVRALKGVIHMLGGAVQQGLADLDAGIKAFDALPPDGETALDGWNRGAIVTGHGVLVAALSLVGRLAEARALGERFLAQEVQSEPASARQAAIRAVETGTVWSGLGIAYAMQGDVEQARHACAVAAASFQASGEHVPRLLTLCREVALVVLPYRADDPLERSRIRSAVEQTPTSSNGIGVDVRDYPLLALKLVEGQWQEARWAADELEDLPSASASLVRDLTLGAIARAQGAPERARQIVRKTLPAGPFTRPESMDVSYVLPMQRLAATLALDAGDLPAARAWLEAHDRWLDWMEASLGRAESALLWARYQQLADNFANAALHAQRALAAATTPRQPLALLAAQRLLGELETQAGRYEMAEHHIAQALALAEACAAPYERAQTLLILAELRLARHQPSDAGQTLAELRAIVTPLAAVPLLARADALERRVEAMQREQAVYPAGLSAREVEVLRLLAVGHTNRAIAEQLYLSPFTVKRHVSSILKKLGVTTRSAATRFAVEQRMI
jgi:DNA-binding CsgD family transcriptional regulator